MRDCFGATDFQRVGSGPAAAYAVNLRGGAIGPSVGGRASPRAAHGAVLWKYPALDQVCCGLRNAADRADAIPPSVGSVRLAVPDRYRRRQCG
jgi:hypothetical protein